MIEVVGIGDDGWSGLDEARRALISGAATLVGGGRHLDLVAPHAPEAQLVPWPSPLRPALPALVEAHPDAVVLASGDPLRSGIATTLVELVGADRVRVHPAIGSDALARARQGWSAEETVVVTTVGRDLRAVLPHLAPGARLVVLLSGGGDPARLGALLTEHGWGASMLTARWHLGSPDEGARSERADGFAEATPDLVLACLDVRADDPAATAATAGPVPGRPEDFIDHDGQLTKRDVRASGLARLRPTPGAHLWDLGAGNGSNSRSLARRALRLDATEATAEGAKLVATAIRDRPRAQALRLIVPARPPRARYDAIVVAVGASTDKKLGITGEDLVREQVADVAVAAGDRRDGRHVLDVVDLAGPGQEDQHVTGALGQGPLHGGGDVGEELPRHPARPQAAGAPRRRPHLL